MGLRGSTDRLVEQIFQRLSIVKIRWISPSTPTSLILKIKDDGPLPLVWVEPNLDFVYETWRLDTHTHRPYVGFAETEQAAHRESEAWAARDLERSPGMLFFGFEEMDQALALACLRHHLESGRVSQPCFPPPPPSEADAKENALPGSAKEWVRGTFVLPRWRAPQF